MWRRSVSGGHTSTVAVHSSFRSRGVTRMAHSRYSPMRESGRDAISSTSGRAAPRGRADPSATQCQRREMIQVLEIERLREITEGPALDGLGGGGVVRAGRDHHDRNGRVELLDRLQDIDSTDARHGEVEEDEI